MAAYGGVRCYKNLGEILLTINEIESEIKNIGGCDKYEVEYSIRYYLPEHKQFIYLNKGSGRNYSGLILHPRYELSRHILCRLTGVNSHSPLLHNSSFRKYPKRLNVKKGKSVPKQPMPYGIPFGFDNKDSFTLFFNKFKGITPSYVRSVYEEIESVALTKEMESLDATDKDSIIKSRIGQGEFRQSLIEKWGMCSVTGCTVVDILRASHVKPWRDSTNKERLDKNNGLLLIPNLDVLFDLGLITFCESGRIEISSFFDKIDLCRLGITCSEKIIKLDEKLNEYLKYHRKYIFQK